MRKTTQRSAGLLISAGMALGLSGSAERQTPDVPARNGCYEVTQIGLSPTVNGETDASRQTRELAERILQTLNVRCGAEIEGDSISHLKEKDRVSIRISRLGAGLMALGVPEGEAPERQAASVSVALTPDDKLDAQRITGFYLYSGSQDQDSGPSYEVAANRDSAAICNWQLRTEIHDGGLGGSISVGDTQQQR